MRTAIYAVVLGLTLAGSSCGGPLNIETKTISIPKECVEIKYLGLADNGFNILCSDDQRKDFYFHITKFKSHWDKYEIIRE